jgi:cytochrome bd-type quinol oxidase subunit 2
LGRRCRHDGAPQPSLFQHPRYSLTIFNAASSPHALRASLVANLAGMIGVILYTSYVHRTFSG